VACLDCTGKRAIKLVVVVVYEKDWADVGIVFLISELRTILITTTEYNTHNCLMACIRDYPGEPVPEETFTHEEEEEGFAQTTRSALSQRGLLDPINPAYNQGIFCVCMYIHARK